MYPFLDEALLGSKIQYVGDSYRIVHFQNFEGSLGIVCISLPISAHFELGTAQLEQVWVIGSFRV